MDYKDKNIYEIEEDIYSVFTIGNDSEVIFVENQ